MKSDSRVKEIVTLYAPLGVTAKRALQPCARGARHIVIPSYGATTRENVGVLFETVRA